MSVTILLENGLIKNDSIHGGVAQQRQRMRDAVNRASQQGKPLVLHLHGGLVNRNDGEAIAEKLKGHYAEAGGVPLFFVWQTGLGEIIRNNYRELLQQNLLKWAVRRIVNRVAGKLNISPAGLYGDNKNLEMDEPDEASMAALEFSEEEQMQEESEQLQDQELDEIADALLQEYEALRQSDVSGLVSEQSAIVSAVIGPETPAALTMNPALFQNEGGQKAVYDMGGIFKRNLVSAIVTTIPAVVRRYMNKTHHGFHATIAEELSRRIHGDKVGAFFWRAMKNDAVEAFGDDGKDRAGNWLLRCLNEANPRPRVLLVGHSAGSVFASRLLQQPEANGTFDLAFLAPAITYSLFAKTLKIAESKIANFRMFAMDDDLECKDRLLPLIYPRSLLYLISGILEGTADTPLLGMKRFHSPDYAATNRDQELLDEIRAFLDGGHNRIVWSQSDNGPGLRSWAQRHGDFDEPCDKYDGKTVDSLKHIITHNFS